MTVNLTNWCVFVTGGAGFLGARLVERLKKSGARVFSVDKAHPQNNDNQRNNDSGCTNIQAELPADFNKLARVMNVAGGAKYAFYHMAGLSHVGKCEENPQLAFELNVALTKSVLQFCRNYNIKRFIFPSTGLVYGDALTRPALESDPALPLNIYTATKIAAEMLISGYCASFGLDAIIIRLSNVYGAGGNHDTIVGTICEQIKNSSTLLLKSLSPVRDFIYVNDVVEGFIRLLDAEINNNNRIVNLATGTAVSIRRLAATALQVANREEVIIREVGDSAATASNLVLDNSRLKELTGWQPNFDLQSGLSLLLSDLHDLCLEEGKGVQVPA